ncbi:hypothetical protein SAMN05443248_7224 [Bradyrhizobium erythrophlei]|jgi:hypothetical protein|uniref:Uncharacterized protein n=1 Tax=Bradyrhizobium erythrophlei TaxID=1437360 RepID=A0A1M5XC66_9BRAD|nr:hypothetical protein SAMN05443248_7224 [Bradyrhizobium erythrophlei]
MRRLPSLAGLRTNVLDRYRSRSIQEVKCCCKTEDTMVVRRMVVLVGGRDGATVSRMLTKLG